MLNTRVAFARFRHASLVLSVVLAAAIFAAVPAAQCHSSADLPNFAQVSGILYRGGQPTTAGFAALHNMGVSTVVNFRDESWEQTSERREVESLGMRYVSIPWSGHDYPSNANIVQFLNLLRDNPQAKVFVHCQRGADRTGTMVAAYRIAVEHQQASAAVAEMHQFHYDHLFLPQLQRYVLSLPHLLQSSSDFQAYAAPAPAIGSPSAVPVALASVAAPVIP